MESDLPRRADHLEVGARGRRHMLGLAAAVFDRPRSLVITGASTDSVRRSM